MQLFSADATIFIFAPENMKKLLSKIGPKHFFSIANRPKSHILFHKLCCYSCNNITTTLIQTSRLFYFGFFSKTNHWFLDPKSKWYT